MAASIEIVYVHPTVEGLPCRNNCVTILKYGDALQPVPTEDPPLGYEWVYDAQGNHVLDENGNRVYTSIHD